MALIIADRVKESCSSPGTGTVTLLGAQTEYRSFSAGVGANNTTYYVIADQSGSNWEVGLGTVGSGGTTLARTTVLSSSNSGSLVNFSSGTQDVWVDYPAGKAVYLDSLGTATVPQLATSSTTNTTPVLGFNASNSGFTSGATVSGSYLQSILQNKSNTAGASTNYVLSNDLGTDSSYYGEFGMNSSVFSASTPSDFFSINNGIYFSGHDGDISFGSGNGYKTYFAWGTTGQSSHVINASGAIGLSTNLGTTPALSGTTGYGTSGQVLTSGGSTAAPTWTTPSSGAMTLISTQTASSSASLAWTGLSGYKNYIILFNQILCSTSGVSLNIQFGEGATPTWQTSSYAYAGYVARTGYGGNFGNNSGQVGISLDGALNLFSPTSQFDGSMQICNMNSTTAYVGAVWNIAANNGTNPFWVSGGGYFLGDSNTLKTAIRLIPISGTITSGTASLYGISS